MPRRPPTAYALGRALTEAVPRSELMWEQLARDALDADRPREAVTILERLHPDSGALSGRAGYYNWLTNAYHLLGEHDRELEAAQRAQRRFPRNLATLRKIGRASCRERGETAGRAGTA